MSAGSAIGQREFELKLAVPDAARDAVFRAFRARRATVRTVRMQALYFDTEDRRLARAGMALRVRRENRQWVQTLKTTSGAGLARREFETIRPDASLDPDALAATPAGDVLWTGARDANPGLVLRYETSMRRLVRSQRVPGGVVELALDEGRIVSGPRSIGVCELEIELLRGSPSAVFGAARRWQDRFGLLVDPRSKAQRGDTLAQGVERFAPVKATGAELARDVCAEVALRLCARACFEQAQRNAVEIALGEGDDEHVHQLRVAIRRLRAVLRFFDGWAEPPVRELEDRARELFGALGASRDLAVVRCEVEPRIVEAGMPQACFEAAEAGAAVGDAATIVAGRQAQAWLLGMLEWLEVPGGSTGRSSRDSAADAHGRALRPMAAKRLRRWHARLAGAAESFAELDAEQRHALRKRAKRLRYATECCAPLFDAKRVRAYLKRLARVQELLGELNDLHVARGLYESRVAEPGAWFARGWIAARDELLAERAVREFERLREARAPWK